nr:interleukin-1 receptor-associated kinase 4 isoform X2 [Equus caballus]
MNKPITPSTYVRCLNLGLIRKLSDFIDPQEGWKKLAVAIKKPSGDDRYNQFHIRRFEALLQTGKSPTCELLFDWGTTNCTVGDLVDLLVQNEFFAPASLLLPDAVPKTVNILPSKEAITIQQKQIPLYGKDRTSVIPVQNPEQNYVPPDSSSPENGSLEVSDTRFHCFSFYELKNVTNNFDERPVSIGGNKMGEGGFGVVYKGYVNNRMVAVKKLAAMVDISTEELKQQFDQEIKVMAKCQHENLVELLGFSSDGDDLCLVYVYMPNGSLLDRLSCLVLLEIITGLPAVDEHREPQLLLDIKDEIEDEEKTIEDYIDKKMNDIDSTSVETMYSVASQCLHEKKNKRPDIKKVQQLLQEMTTS